ncbi:hypothetical protein L249_5668 [Ophiocordyceps polyrhachis-furcata BCC 54312]|uniref:Uncharacterized protein n=1 Tax=Ophiocordyceps polyrhachis-furcata BCC 54312 TaxID=1330021 RepID=A0A367L014_9HYPO|nr:hypothetical protein L249_5668 [Ophiocordyceps polyrhachis-furcata BCC 54312]
MASPDASSYSSKAESNRILSLIHDIFDNDSLSLPAEVTAKSRQVRFRAGLGRPYFPIPFKQTETAAALKAIEASVAALLADSGGHVRDRNMVVDLEKTTAFLFQAYLARIGGLGKLDAGVRSLLKDTDYLQAQSNPYRRMAANLYATADEGEFYHIHGSLEASTTLQMLGLAPYRPDLNTHRDIVDVIEPAVRKHTVAELEALNAHHRQAGVKAFKHHDFLQTPHGKAAWDVPPWTVERLEDKTPPRQLPQRGPRLLAGVRVVELCRIIAGPIMGRILAEYGADVLKVTGPGISDVPFFQVDGNMGKHAAELDLKTVEGRAAFDRLLESADVVLDGYRPGVLDRLGYGAGELARRAERRGWGIVYVAENCFGHRGEWAHRPGWQQIADCASGIAWDQGRFMGLDEPVVPPFPISDYGTGCMGAIAALTGLLQRSARGGSWLGTTSLLQYDLLLYKAGPLPDEEQRRLRDEASAEFLSLRHAHSVDAVSGAALRQMRTLYPGLIDSRRHMDRWFSSGYRAEVAVVKPVVEVDGLQLGFSRATRPNGMDEPSWESFGDDGRGMAA